jgi:hypothetical protein|tara:strand:- start:475 stop:744 length:270 start_codon:yes stop_codon:yes gene_type:complete
MLISESHLRKLVCEALTDSDKKSIERIARREFKSLFKDEFMKKIEKEIDKKVMSKENKADIIDLVKKVMIKVHKEFAFNQPHIIRQIKV